MAKTPPYSQAGLSEAAQTELLELCEQQFARLQMLQNEILLNEPDFSDDSQVTRLTATEAEMKQWQTAKPQMLPSNQEVLLKAGKEEMLKVCSELEMIVSCYRAKKEKVMQTKRLEQEWFEEQKQVLAAVSDKVKSFQREKEDSSGHSELQDVKERIQKMKSYQERLTEALGNILEKHVPPPQVDFAAKKKKNVPEGVHEDLKSLNEILELLMNKSLTTAHDPYVTLDSTFWPPYVELLLRHSIAVRHQENHFKIRLETFL